MSSSNLTFYAAASGLILATVWLMSEYVFPSKPKVRKKDLPPGLVNIGWTTCYCNTILQCLAPLQAFRFWLGKISQQFPGENLHNELFQTLEALNNHCDRDIILLSSAHLLDLLDPNSFNLYDQQDCHEFFLIICEKLQSVTLINRPIPGIQHHSTSFRKKSLVKFPFSGRNSTCLYCTACGCTYPSKIEQFLVLSLFVPHKSTVNRFHSIESLLEASTSEELLIDAICEKCSRKGTLRKKVSLFSTPNLLCLQIIRSNWINERATKTVDPVVFSETLNVTSYKRYKTEQQEFYRLRSVIVHFGATSSRGHFACYRRSPSGKKWCFASDEEIHFVDNDKVFSSEPYMLFYEKLTREEK